MRNRYGGVSGVMAVKQSVRPPAFLSSRNEASAYPMSEIRRRRATSHWQEGYIRGHETRRKKDLARDLLHADRSRERNPKGAPVMRILLPKVCIGQVGF